MEAMLNGVDHLLQLGPNLLGLDVMAGVELSGVDMDDVVLVDRDEVGAFFLRRCLPSSPL